MKYFVTIAGRTVEVTVDGEQVTVGGRTVAAHLRLVPGTPLWSLELDGRRSTVALEREPDGGLLALHEGTRVPLEVVDERTRHIRSLTAAARGASGPGVLKAPMPGLVVRIPVEVGQSVGAGQGVVVLEAMKMENELKASAPAVVRAVLVAPGQAVEKGQVLVEFAPEGATG